MRRRSVWGFIAFIFYLVLTTPSRRLVTCAWALMLVGKLLQETLAPGVSWSPYYKVVTEKVPAKPDMLVIGVNGVPHQLMAPAKWKLEQGEAIYRTPYLRLPGNPLDDVLIIGAGSGSDVAIALSKQARHVDAVDIDPRILQIGMEQNPDRPYADKRVKMHTNDGRAFLEKHGPQVRPRSFRTARLADTGQRCLADPARVVSVHAGSAGFRAQAPETPWRLRACTITTGSAGSSTGWPGTVATTFGHAPCVDTFDDAQAVISIGMTAADQRCETTWTRNRATA